MPAKTKKKKKKKNRTYLVKKCKLLLKSLQILEFTNNHLWTFNYKEF